MDSIMSLGGPLKQFTSYLAVRRSSFSRRRSISRRRSLPCSSQKVPDSWLRVYQDELKRERGTFTAVDGSDQMYCLFYPCQATPARKSAKDDSFFGAFQGLSLEGLMGSSNGRCSWRPV
uniref:Uncharacterized protein n=1 Tax=Takifugu rubripes TaxID=31033 RepID=A0A3B5JX73_TAKRU